MNGTNASDTALQAWPAVSKDLCEANYAVVPWIAEFWSAVSALFIVVSGLVPLLTSPYSDDLIDLVCAFNTLNGLFAALSHATLLGIFGKADELSIYLCWIIYIKALILAHSPQLYAKPGLRTALNLVVALGICFSICWDDSQVPHWARVDMTSIIMPVICICALVGMCRLGYSRSTWVRFADTTPPPP